MLALPADNMNLLQYSATMLSREWPKEVKSIDGAIEDRVEKYFFRLLPIVHY